MLQSFLTPFLTILLAEMLDKSQLALMLLSTKSKKYVSLFLGSLLAFIVVDGVAILFGSFIAQVIPEMIVKLIAGGAFILFGILSFRADDEEKERKLLSKNMALNAFVLVFLAEWGDKTQLASAAFATQFEPLFVFLGVVSAMAILSLLAIILGGTLAKKVNKQVLQKIAGVVFLIIGGYLLFF